jgi:hypothetical protein
VFTVTRLNLLLSILKSELFKHFNFFLKVLVFTL